MVEATEFLFELTLFLFVLGSASALMLLMGACLYIIIGGIVDEIRGWFK